MGGRVTGFRPLDACPAPRPYSMMTDGGGATPSLLRLIRTLESRIHTGTLLTPCRR